MIDKQLLLKSISCRAYEFLHDIKDEDIEDIHEGRIELGENEFALIQSYETKKREELKYEEHAQYIDVQYILEGEEVIEIAPANMLMVHSPYDEKKDIVFFENEYSGDKCKLEKGEYIIIFPGQAHMPCIMTGATSRVKKIVVKIPVCKTPSLLFMDVDGTLTDGKIYMGIQGELFKAFDIKDGYAISKILPEINYIPIIITGRKSDIVEQRCKELNIKLVYQGVADKKELLTKIASSFGLFPNNNDILPKTAYFGDDIPDLECMKYVELKGCPADAVKEIRSIVDYVCLNEAGHGAGREFIEWIKDNKLKNIIV